MSQTIIIGANDPNIAYLLQRYAEESGYASTRVCASGDAPDVARTAQPALVILDIEPGAVADWDVVRRLKAQPETAEIPIVVYSCLDSPPDSWREGVDGYVLKSVLYNDFVFTLSRARAGQPSAVSPLPPELPPPCGVAPVVLPNAGSAQPVDTH